jgi:undecaprenyl-diphosphatase
MNLLEAVVLGAVQGVTEFFPVSSSGHLVIFQHLFGMKEPQLAFDIFLHIGTLASVLIFFRHDITALFGRDRKLLAPLAIASVPTFIIGFFFKDTVERLFGAPSFVGYMLIVTSAWLFAASLYERNRARAEKNTNSWPGMAASLLVGSAQGVAVLPGISRSGATIATGIMSGMEKSSACRFSFLLSVPAVAGASILKLHKIGAGLTAADAPQFIAGGIASALFGIASIKFLLRIVSGGKLYLFGIYCFLAGLITIILV